MDFRGFTDFVFACQNVMSFEARSKTENIVFLVLTGASENGNWHFIEAMIQLENKKWLNRI
jgi:hypothetical protein